MQIINLTPHTVTVNGTAIPPDGRVPRVGEVVEPAGEITLPGGATAPVVTVRPGAVEGLPAPQPDTMLIVSRMVAEAAPERRDLVVPHGLVRDGQGRVVGCAQLAQVPAETIVVSARMEQGDVESVRVTVTPAVADALRALGAHLSIWVEDPAERAEMAARWRQRLADLPDDAPEREELERLLERDLALSEGL